MSKNAPKVHEWEGSKSGIRKHYRKILYPTAGVALVGTTTAAVVLPIMIKKMAEDKFAKILPIGGPVNSLSSSTSVAAKGGKVNYVAIGDSVTAGFNGYLSSNDVVRDAVKTGTDVNGTPENTKALLEEIDALEKEIATLKAASNPDLAKIKAKEDIKSFLELQMEDHASHTTKDYLSYADFVANDLAKANKLNDYRNFALTGATVPNLRQTVLRNTTALAALQNADLISISIGANDLLAAVEVLRLSFNAVRGEADTDKVSQFNIARNAIEAITKVNEVSHEPDEDQGNHRATSPSAYASEQDTKNLIKKSFYKFVNMLNSGSLSGLLDIEQELLNNIFSLIQLDTATAINEIHKAAPDAKIVLMGYAFPFHLLPASIIDSPIVSYDETKFSGETTPKTLDGHQKTLREVFMTLIDKLKGTVERANYVKFFDINNLKEFSKDSEDVTYKLEGDADNAEKTVTRPEWDRVMPNPLDIHPSTYGHQVIAGHLYEWIARDLGLNVPDYQSVQKLPQSDSHIADLERIYTYAGIDKNFDIKDEKVAYDSDSLVSLMGNLNNKFYLRILGSVVQKIADPAAIAEHYKEIKDGFKNIEFDSKNIGKSVDDFYKVIKPALNLNEPFGNVTGFTVGKFFDQLVATIKSVHWDKMDVTLEDADGKLDTKQIVIDLLDPAKGDGIVIIEFLMMFGIYLGDNGQPIAKTSSEHTPVSASDTFMRNIVSNIKADTKETFRQRVAEVNAGRQIDMDGDSTLYMLLQYVQMNLNAFNADKSFQLVNLAAVGPNGERTPWVVVNKVDMLPESSNFSKVIDEIKALGIKFGMDISGFFTGVQDMEDFGTSLFMGDALSSKVWIYKVFGDAGFDVSTKSFWNAGPNAQESLRQQAKKAGVDLKASFDSIFDQILDFSSNHSAY